MRGVTGYSRSSDSPEKMISMRPTSVATLLAQWSGLERPSNQMGKR
jgi:hypothetical protein